MGCAPCIDLVFSTNFGSSRYCLAVRGLWLKVPSKRSLAHCRVCSIWLGKFLRVQMGMLFSGGSWDELYDSVTSGMTTYGYNG